MNPIYSVLILRKEKGGEKIDLSFVSMTRLTSPRPQEKRSELGDSKELLIKNAFETICDVKECYDRSVKFIQEKGKYSLL